MIGPIILWHPRSDPGLVWPIWLLILLHRTVGFRVTLLCFPFDLVPPVPPDPSRWRSEDFDPRFATEAYILGSSSSNNAFLTRLPPLPPSPSLGKWR